jgi:hypothetical protein
VNHVASLYSGTLSTLQIKMIIKLWHTADLVTIR